MLSQTFHAVMDALISEVGGLQSALGAFSSTLENTGNPVEAFAAFLADAITQTQAFQDAAKVLEQIWESFIKVLEPLGEVFLALMRAIQPIVELIMVVLEPAIKLLAELLLLVIKGFAMLWNALMMLITLITFGLVDLREFMIDIGGLTDAVDEFDEALGSAARNVPRVFRDAFRVWQTGTAPVEEDNGVGAPPRERDGFEDEMPDTEGIPSMIGLGFLDTLIEEMLGVIDTFIEEFGATLRVLIDNLGMIIDTFLTEFGKTLRTLIITLGEIITTFITEFGKTLRTLIITLGEIITTFITEFGKTLRTLIDNVGMIIDTFITEFGKTLRTLIDNVGMIIDTFITEFGATLRTLIDNVGMIIDTFITEFGATLRTIVDNVGMVLDTFVSEVGKTTRSIVSDLTGVADTFISELGTALDSAVSGVFSLAETIVETGGGIIETGLETIGKLVPWSGDDIDTGAIVRELGNVRTDIVHQSHMIKLKYLRPIRRALVNLQDILWEAFFHSDGVIEQILLTNEWLQRIVKLLGGTTRLATGGIVTSPTLSFVGEGGPEAVIPLDRLEQIIANGGGGGGGDTIVIQGDVYGYEDFAQKVHEASMRKSSRNSRRRHGIS